MDKEDRLLLFFLLGTYLAHVQARVQASSTVAGEITTKGMELAKSMENRWREETKETP